MTLIVYSDSDETIVTTPEDENQTIKLWFTEGGRDIEEYDRQEFIGTVAVKATNKLDGQEAPDECYRCGEAVA